MIFAWCPEGDPLLSQSVATCMMAGAAAHSILNLRPLLRRRNLGCFDNNGDESVPCQSIYKGREGRRWPSGTCSSFGFSPMTPSVNGFHVGNAYPRPTASIAVGKRERANNCIPDDLGRQHDVGGVTPRQQNGVTATFDGHAQIRAFFWGQRRRPNRPR